MSEPRRFPDLSRCDFTSLRSLGARLAVALILSNIAATTGTAAPDVTPPSLATCDGQSPPTYPGSTPATPGRWWNPKRSGTSWDLYYTEDQLSMMAQWYTYDRSRRPVWLLSRTEPIDRGNNTWTAILDAVTWDHGSNAVATITRVGSVAITFDPNNASRAALRWQWDEADLAATFDECVFDYLRPQPDAEEDVSKSVNTTYTGSWYEPAFGGYGIAITIGPLQTTGAANYIELDVITVYDSTGYPAWVDAQSPAFTTPPPENVPASYPLNYYRSSTGYPQGVPINDCAADCIVIVPNVGNLDRTFTSQTTATALINIDAQPAVTGGQQITWKRPADLVGTVVLNKLTAATSILVDRLQCTVPSGQSTCPITVNWGSLFPNARPYRYDIPSATSVLIGNAPVGEYVDNLPAGARVSYHLLESVLLAYTPEVRATQDEEEGNPATPPAHDNPATPPANAASDSIGASLGTFRVDEGGQANYTMPIYTPPGRAGVVPELALAYSSGGGHGMMGPGWSLSGLSAIARCRVTPEAGDTANLYGGIDYTLNDQFCLDGQRLVLVAGSHGRTDAEYRTERDAFLRIRVLSEAISDGAGAWFDTIYPVEFEVRGRDGTIRRYGGATGQLTGRHPQYTTPVVAGWLITESRDSVGNAIGFTYETQASPDIAERKPTQIAYVGGKITFSYRTLTFQRITRQFSGGVESRTSALLESIDVYAETSLGIYTPAPVRTFDLQYSSPSARHDLERVTGVQECAGSVCYPPTWFRWLDASPTVEARAGADLFRDFGGFKHGDLDGDGRVDTIWVNIGVTGGDDTLHAAFSTPAAAGATPGIGLTFPPTGVVPFDDAYSESRGWQLLDYNADGRDDLLYAEAGNWVVRLAIATAPTTSAGQVFGPASVLFAIDNERTEASLADLNGDGLFDLITPAGTGPTALFVRYMERTGVNGSPYRFSATKRLIRLLDVDGVPCNAVITYPDTAFDSYEPIDANGDGRADLRFHVAGSRPSGRQP